MELTEMMLIWSAISSACFRLLLILGILALLVRLKVKIGRVLIAAPFIAALLFASRALPSAFAKTVVADGYSFVIKTTTLLALIALINFFGALLKETEKLPRLMSALMALFKDTRMALAGMPVLIGMLPMPGGALLSAPMVEEIAQSADPKVSAEDKSLVNYLFRHTWEYFLPVYPAILMAVVIWRTDFGQLASKQIVLSIAALAGGLIFILRPIGPLTYKPAPGTRTDEDNSTGQSPLGAILTGVLPIAAVFVTWYVLRAFQSDGPKMLGAARVIAWKPWARVSLVVALLLVNAAIVLRSRVSAIWVWNHIKKSMPFDMFLLMLGAMLFQAVVESAGAVGTLARELETLNVPLVLVIFALPFVAGMVSGIAVFYVTVAFPILTGVIQVGGGYDAPATVLAFAAGYAGVLLSPVHLCLLLTVEHFGADMGKVYRRLLGPVGLTLVVAFAQYFLHSRL